MPFLLKKTLAFFTVTGIALATLLAATAGAPAQAAAVSLTDARATYNLNIDWKLFVGDANGAEAIDFRDTAWKSVTLPHAWNEDEAFKKDIHDLSSGIAWYRKHFTLVLDNLSEKKVFLEFEGVRHAAEV